jgi:putative ATPase
MVMFGAIAQVGKVLSEQAPEVRFDWILSRNGLGVEVEKGAIVRQLAALLQPSGSIAFTELLPRQSQRLYDLIPEDRIETKLRKRWVKAEEQIYGTKGGDPLLNWEMDDILKALQSAGFKTHCEVEPIAHALYITSPLMDRWFAAGAERLSYADRLLQTLPQKEVEQIRGVLTQHLMRQTVQWHRAIAYVTARRET